MRFAVGLRWWLALVIALIAAFTAAAGAFVSSSRSEKEFRERAADAAAGRALGAAIAVTERAEREGLATAARSVAEERRLAIFVFGPDGQRLTGPRSQGIAFASIPERRRAVATALAGRRFVETNEPAQATVVALPIRLGAPTNAMVTYAPHPLLAGIGIVREEVIRAMLWATLLGGAVGLVVATLIGRRLGRIADAAAAIETGQFDRRLRPRFGDEVGQLAGAIDRMRRRLGESFAQLESERSRLARLLGRLHEGVVMFDRSLRIEVANAAARQLLDAALHPGDELPDRWGDPPLRSLAAALFSGSGAEPREWVVNVDSDRVYMLVGLPPHGSVDSAVLVVADVSERERRERAEREFVANAAHELRTPLTTIIGAAEALEAGAKEVPDQRDRFVAHIEREARRLARLARALLVLARAQTGTELPRFEPVELRPLLDDVAGRLALASGVELRVSCPPGLTVSSQRDLVEQVVVNVAENAAKNTVKGRIVLSAAAEGSGVVLEISDTGHGMGRVTRERVFDRFYRAGGRSHEGFGIGLAIVREAVRALHGDVRIQSELGLGTTVRIRLPAMVAEVA